MKKLIYLSVIALFIAACGGDTAKEEATNSTAETDVEVKSETSQEEYDHMLGTGKYNEENFVLPSSVDAELAKKGDAIYGAKCQSCHKLTNEQLVGPGFKGVSERRTPVWIMNFLTNTDEMIDLDPALQEQLEVCMVRMPDQALTEVDAKAMVDFFRKNDGVN